MKWPLYVTRHQEIMFISNTYITDWSPVRILSFKNWSCSPQLMLMLCFGLMRYPPPIYQLQSQ